MGKTEDKVTSKVHPTTIHDFADLPENIGNVDIPMSAEDVLGKELIILGYSEHKSEYGPGYYALIEAEMHGETIEISTGARHVLKQLDELHTYLPIKCVFKKQGRSFFLDKK